jgi:hypothetical protein
MGSVAAGFIVAQDLSWRRIYRGAGFIVAQDLSWRRIYPAIDRIMNFKKFVQTSHYGGLAT